MNLDGYILNPIDLIPIIAAGPITIPVCKIAERYKLHASVDYLE